MRSPIAILIALLVAVPAALATAAPAQATQSGPTGYDVPAPFAIAPSYFPLWATDYYTSLDPQYGRADKVVVTGMANGLGINNVPSATSADCTPDPSMGGPTMERGGARTDWIDQNCRFHRNSLTLNVGSVAAPSDSGAWELSGSHRYLFHKNSSRSDCLSDEPIQFLGMRYNQREITLDRGFLPGLGYLCLAQGYTVKATYYTGGTVKSADYYYRVRGPWTVYKAVGLGEIARPTNIRVQPNGTSMRVSWDFPSPLIPDPLGTLRRNVLPNTRFVVKSSPDDRFCRAVGRTSCVVTGLRPGTAYSFTIRVERLGSQLTTEPTAPVVLGAPAQPTPAPSNPAPSNPAPSSPAPSTPAPSNPASDITPLTPQVRSLTASTTPQPGGNVQVTSMVTGQLRAGESVSQRTLVVCFAATANGPCTRTRTYPLATNLLRDMRTFLVPRDAAGGFMRVQQQIAVSPGPGLIGAIKVSQEGVSRVTM